MKAQEAITLLEGVPEEDFIKGTYSNGVNKCCSLGHLNRLASEFKDDYGEHNCSVNAAVALLRSNAFTFIRDKYDTSYTGIANVNDYDNVNGYTESTSKQRVLHLLRDMHEAGY